MSNTHKDAKPDHRELTETELKAASGGKRSTIHPAKVTVPDLKLNFTL